MCMAFLGASLPLSLYNEHVCNLVIFFKVKKYDTPMRKLVIYSYTLRYYCYYIHVHVGMRVYWFCLFTIRRLQQQRMHSPIQKQMLEDDRREAIVDFFSGIDNHWLWWINRAKCSQIWKLLQIHERRCFTEA